MRNYLQSFIGAITHFCHKIITFLPLFLFTTLIIQVLLNFQGKSFSLHIVFFFFINFNIKCICQKYYYLYKESMSNRALVYILGVHQDKKSIFNASMMLQLWTSQIYPRVNVNTQRIRQIHS